MEDGMKNEEMNVSRRIFFLLVLIIVFSILAACNNPSMIPVTVVPEIHVKALPANITSVVFTVTGPGMDPLSASYDSLPDSITLAVPPGEDRYFELIVYIDGLLGLTPALSFKGSATVDLTPGDVVVELTMRLDSTKLVVPDFQNQRVIQFDDIGGGGAQYLVGTDLLGLGWLDSDFMPYDIDFDDQGRIYIANYNAASGYARVIRVDNILGTNSFLFTDWATSIVALTVDRNNDYLYYYTSVNELWRVNLDGTNEVSRDITGITAIRGMAVDEEGILYIAGATALAPNSVFQYDPVAESVTATYTTGINQPWDTLVKGDYVYVANTFGGVDLQILQLPLDFSSSVGYGNSGATTLPGIFYGPRRFVAILNEEITIIDDDIGGGDLDKLISIDDITGANWTTLPVTGDGQGLFHFYSFGP
jgi:hypothetical protein